jgi:L-aminopeptidase/D-esterase-like protein
VNDDHSITLGIAGVLVGQWTDTVHRTGCTVVLFPDGTVASGEVRGGAPATREFALLDPIRLVERIDAVVLSGGSAFGLAAADGVVDFCAEHDRGFTTPGGKVPIVVAMSLYDLTQGHPLVRPGAREGLAAARAAKDDRCPTGLVGAGTGATVGKWRGKDHIRPGGLGVATVRRDDLVVAAVIAVNAAGDIDDGSAADAIAAGTFEWPPAREPFADEAAAGANTTIGVIITNARLDKVGCNLVAQSGHDGFARALFPAHTRGDGDALVAAAIGSVEAPLEVVRMLGTVAVVEAIRSVVTTGAGVD